MKGKSIQSRTIANQALAAIDAEFPRDWIPQRERLILERMAVGDLRADIAQDLGVTPERCRQLHWQALERIKDFTINRPAGHYYYGRFG